MQDVELKLKQASAVLGVDPKDLQNLVQFKVLRPRRRDSFYWFDNRLLLQAKVALHLKESLGTSTELLALFTQALSENLTDEESAAPRYRSHWPHPHTQPQSTYLRIPPKKNVDSDPATWLRSLFPNQDTMPNGGLANLIALPFSNGQRTAWTRLKESS